MKQNKYYTALLLNCYVKQGGNKLKGLIESASFDVSMLDTDTAIEVCKESKELECAMLLARKAKNIDQEIRLLLENPNKGKEALSTILQNVVLEKQPMYFRKFGQELIRQVPNELYYAVQSVAENLIKVRDEDSGSASKYAQQFRWLKEIFVDNMELNKKFIDFLIKANDKCEPEVYHGLIEWLLQDYNISKKQLDMILEEEKKLIEEAQENKKQEEQTEEETKGSSAKTEEETKGSSAKTVEALRARKKVLVRYIKKKKDALTKALKDHKDKYDKRHALMLVEMYQIPEAVGLLCEMLELTNELITYYIKSQDYPRIVEVCKKFGASDQNLWIQALSFFVVEQEKFPSNTEVSECIEDILTSLEEVSVISPVMVLEIVGRNKSIKYSVIKKYLIEKLKKIQGAIDKSRKTIVEYDESIKKTKQTINNLRTTAQVLHIRECSDCGKKLELPLYHFTCNHSYHEYCIPSEASIKECPKCCIQAQQVLDKKAQLLGQADNQEQFFKELKESDRKFDVVSQYFGRGLFSNVENDKGAADKIETDFIIEDF